MKTETCPRCGGDGGEPGSNFGDYGWHPCFFCGASGLVAEGTAKREEENAALFQELYRPLYNDLVGCASDDGSDDLPPAYREVAAATVVTNDLSELPF